MGVTELKKIDSVELGDEAEMKPARWHTGF